MPTVPVLFWWVNADLPLSNPSGYQPLSDTWAGVRSCHPFSGSILVGYSDGASPSLSNPAGLSFSGPTLPPYPAGTLTGGWFAEVSMTYTGDAAACTGFYGYYPTYYPGPNPAHPVFWEMSHIQSLFFDMVVTFSGSDFTLALAPHTIGTGPGAFSCFDWLIDSVAYSQSYNSAQLRIAGTTTHTITLTRTNTTLDTVQGFNGDNPQDYLGTEHLVQVQNYTLAGTITLPTTTDDIEIQFSNPHGEFTAWYKLDFIPIVDYTFAADETIDPIDASATVTLGATVTYEFKGVRVSDFTTLFDVTQSSPIYAPSENLFNDEDEIDLTVKATTPFGCQNTKETDEEINMNRLIGTATDLNGGQVIAVRQPS